MENNKSNLMMLIEVIRRAEYSLGQMEAVYQRLIRTGSMKISDTLIRNISNKKYEIEQLERQLEDLFQEF